MNRTQPHVKNIAALNVPASSLRVKCMAESNRSVIMGFKPGRAAINVSDYAKTCGISVIAERTRTAPNVSAIYLSPIGMTFAYGRNSGQSGQMDS